MLSAALLTVFASQLAVASDDYAGRFQDDPRLEPLQRTLNEALPGAYDAIPEWLSKQPPRAVPRLVDLDAPPVWAVWPTAIAQGYQTVKEVDGESVGTFDLPLEPLLADPTRCRATLVRRLVSCICQESVPKSAVFPGRIGDLSEKNPVIYGMGSFLAGELTQEIDYLLSKHLESDEALDGLFADIVPNASGRERWRLRDRPEDDVTFLFLIHDLTPKGKDKHLATLYEAIFRGKDVEAGLKKATRKSLRQLNPSLRKAYGKYLEERFPMPERQLYRELNAQINAQEWAEAAVSGMTFLQRYPDSIAAPNAACLRARALGKLDPEAGTVALAEVLDSTRSMASFAWEAQLQLALLARSSGDFDAARAAMKRLREDFGWIPGCWERAEEELKELATEAD